MFLKMFRRGGPSLNPSNENAPDTEQAPGDQPQAANVRALATGAALAVSIDSSPAVLVTIYDYAHRYRDGVHKRSA
jgi:hypothetical protein